MKRLLLALAFIFGSVSLATAQAPTPPCITGSSSASGAIVYYCDSVRIDNPLPITGGTANGNSTTKVLSTASTNSNLIIAGIHNLNDISAYNTNAATAYLKFYDKATAPTCNSDPVKLTYPLIQNIAFNKTSLVGISFSAGIGICITGGIADNDNTNSTTGIVVNLGYK